MHVVITSMSSFPCKDIQKSEFIRPGKLPKGSVGKATWRNLCSSISPKLHVTYICCQPHNVRFRNILRTSAPANSPYKYRAVGQHRIRTRIGVSGYVYTYIYSSGLNVLLGSAHTHAHAKFFFMSLTSEYVLGQHHMGV